MKIGIITLPLHTNYGGILQAYALQTILERMGHEVKVWDKQKDLGRQWYRYFMGVMIRAVLKCFGLYSGTVVPNEARQKAMALAKSNVQKFINRHINVRPFYKFEDINPDEIDCIVVGSDQIWRARYFKNISSDPADMFLAFASEWNIKRISYAASLGTDQWELDNESTKRCAYYVQMFDAVSVREDSGVVICLKHLGITPECVLDPTMLLSRQDYMNLTHNTNIYSHPIVSYILDVDDNKTAIVDYMGARYGEVYSINSKDIPVPSVEFWLDGLLHAERMVTDSFHGTAFSINLNIPFVVIPNPCRGQSRLLSILKMFHLEDRLVSSVEQVIEIMEKPIDWNFVNSILLTQRQKSITFLSEI